MSPNCPKCNGRGERKNAWSEKMEPCANCKGRGLVSSRIPKLKRVYKKCSQCNGKGKYDNPPLGYNIECFKCGGTGKVEAGTIEIFE